MSKNIEQPVSDTEKELIKELATLHDVNFMKGILGLLLNDREKEEMLRHCRREEELTRVKVEEFLLEIVRKRK